MLSLVSLIKFSLFNSVMYCDIIIMCFMHAQTLQIDEYNKLNLNDKGITGDDYYHIHII